MQWAVKKCFVVLASFAVVAVIIATRPIFAENGSLVALDERTLSTTRGLDNQTRSAGAYSCGDVNADIANDQWPESNCLEGHGCVHCSALPLGELTGGTGDPLHLPGNADCDVNNNGVERLIGVCRSSAPNPGTWCDFSNAYVDGWCGGVVVFYRGQPIDP
jgi:hypothetical protein